MKKPYKGESVDVFASGVVLFIMVARHPPFTKAVAGDKFYKPIGSGRPELFWAAMEKYKSPGYYSDDFKDLVTQMLALRDT